MNTTDQLLDKACQGGFLDRDEAIFLYRNASEGALMEAAHAIRMKIHPGHEVGWIIDRNVNITNICISFCSFCNFCRREDDPDAYVTTMDEYRDKIRGLFALGGDQLLLQGGLHPRLGLDFYIRLFRNLKEEFPDLKLHALGPPEVVHLAKMEQCSFEEALVRLCEAGLDSLPGAGAEILVDRIRNQVSKVKCSAGEWLEVMRIAHRLNLPTSATMMFGHIEKPEDRVDHLLVLRDVQSEKPDGHFGFLNFVPWPFMDEGTVLREKKGIINHQGPRDYIRLIAISRLVLQNIQNIQPSWLTTGIQTGQVCLHAGANDFGSIMIEEHVVSAAGAAYRMDTTGIQEAIRQAGFIPRKRNQRFEFVD
ncbi:MAG: CofH family radical SAM protein [Bacteroidales bacterium]|nr:CofH family radical SAM protein [Bacteroidales bacterium]